MIDASFEQVRGAEQFFAAPAGRLFLRSHFAYLGASDELLSLVIWGHIGRKEVSELIDTLSLASPNKQRDALLQMHAIAGIEEESLRLFARFMAETEERSRAVTRREAIVRPSGTSGMIVAGFYGVVAVRYPTAIFAKREDACDWLSVPTDVRASLCRASDAIIEAARTTPDTLYQVRELLAERPTLGNIDAAAKVLGTTARTLQRRLAEVHTTFECELGLARVAAAKTLLLRTSHAIKEVAHEVGLPSASRLSQLFAAHERMSPTEWRSRLLKK